jgi:hypothetical protein
MRRLLVTIPDPDQGRFAPGSAEHLQTSRQHA